MGRWHVLSSVRHAPAADHGLAEPGMPFAFSLPAHKSTRGPGSNPVPVTVALVRQNLAEVTTQTTP